jgi:NADH dehydrogenase [ubiquinone] 1 alpha subcomplex assembly factor 6
VALAASDAARRHNLTTSFLKRLITAREKSGDDAAFDSLAEAERYAENVNSTLLYLTLETLGTRSTEADHCASHIVCEALSDMRYKDPLSCKN